MTDGIQGEGPKANGARVSGRGGNGALLIVRADSEDAVLIDKATMQGQEGSLACRVLCLNRKSISIDLLLGS